MHLPPLSVHSQDKLLVQDLWGLWESWWAGILTKCWNSLQGCIRASCSCSGASLLHPET